VEKCDPAGMKKNNSHILKSSRETFPDVKLIAPILLGTRRHKKNSLDFSRPFKVHGVEPITTKGNILM